MFKENIIMPIIESYTKNEKCYTFVFDNGETAIYPINAVIEVEDVSDYVTFKLIASRANIGIYKNN